MNGTGEEQGGADGGVRGDAADDRARQPSGESLRRGRGRPPSPAGRRGHVLQVRLSDGEKAALAERAVKAGLKPGQLGREAIHRLLGGGLGPYTSGLDGLPEVAEQLAVLNRQLAAIRESGAGGNGGNGEGRLSRRLTPEMVERAEALGEAARARLEAALADATGRIGNRAKHEGGEGADAGAEGQGDRTVRKATVTPKRSETLSVRLTPPEKAGLVRLAARHGVAPSRLARRMIREAGLPGVIDPFPSEAAALWGATSQVTAAGRNLNQIAKAVNRGAAVIDRETRDDLFATLTAVRKVRDEVRATLMRAKTRSRRLAGPVGGVR